MKLCGRARDRKWDETTGMVPDEMLQALTVEAALEKVGSALKERYEGLIDRVALYLPFFSGERDDFWGTIVEAVNGG